jgi:hypothetical protein
MKKILCFSFIVISHVSLQAGEFKVNCKKIAKNYSSLIDLRKAQLKDVDYCKKDFKDYEYSEYIYTDSTNIVPGKEQCINDVNKIYDKMAHCLTEGLLKPAHKAGF